MKIAIYARRSEEKDTGESIENQLSICRKYVELKFPHCTIDEYYDDDYSGRNMNRPQFSKMMKLVKAKIYEYLVFWKLDRISRNALDFLELHNELEKIGVNLISVTEGFDPSTASGKLMMIILASVAEMERKNISLRVSTAMIESAKKGRWSGGNPPFGYKTLKINEFGKDVPYLTEDKEKLFIVTDAFNKYLSSNSLHATSRMLKEKYNVSKTPSDIRKMLINPVYVKSSHMLKEWFQKQGVEVHGNINGNGLISYGKQDFTSEDGKMKSRAKCDWVVAVGNHKGIINDWEYIKICNMVESRKRGRSGTGNNTFLNPLVHCSYCGSYMRVKIMKQNNKVYKYFECDRKNTSVDKCENKYVRVDEFEIDVLNKLEEIYLNKEHFLSTTKIKNNGNDINLLKSEVDKKSKQIKNLVKKMSLNDDIEDILADEIRELKSEIIAINTSIDNLEKENILNLSATINKEKVFESLKNIKKIINNASDIDAKREIITSVVRRITVDGVNKKFEVDLRL